VRASTAGATGFVDLFARLHERRTCPHSLQARTALYRLAQRPSSQLAPGHGGVHSPVPLLGRVPTAFAFASNGGRIHVVIGAYNSNVVFRVIRLCTVMP